MPNRAHFTIIINVNIVLFDENEIGQPLKNTDERAKHILQILHLCEGDTFEAGIVGKSCGKATIKKIESGQISFDYTADLTQSGKPLFPVTLVVGFVRPIQLRRLFRDVASLGVQKLVLCATQLGEKSYQQSNIVQQATDLLREGTVQAKSVFVPDFENCDNLQKCLTNISKNQNQVLIALDNVRAHSSLTEFLAKNYNAQTDKGKNIVAAIGSERGWTESERDLLENFGFTLCSMGERVLRTETAATVATSIIMEKIGALGGNNE